MVMGLKLFYIGIYFMHFTKKNVLMLKDSVGWGKSYAALFWDKSYAPPLTFEIVIFL